MSWPLAFLLATVAVCFSGLSVFAFCVWGVYLAQKSDSPKGEKPSRKAGV